MGDRHFDLQPLKFQNFAVISSQATLLSMSTLRNIPLDAQYGGDALGYPSNRAALYSAQGVQNKRAGEKPAGTDQSHWRQ